MRHNPWIQLTVLLLVTATGCDPSASRGQPSETPLMVPQSTRHEVDLLVVVDNSSSMAGEQANLRTSFSPLVALKSAIGGLPDLHLGVISTDVGTANALESGCDAEGDGGRLLTRNCTNPVGAPYIVDVAPRDCEIQREPSGTCSSAHTCGPEHCAHEPSTTFVMDSATGCPRCRNYSGESLEDVFSCIANLGTMGCNWEQPLESLHRALDPENAHNAGFLRESSVLGILFITDEDDCSASDPLLFSREPDSLDGPLGPFSSFRCFEQGVTCDVDDRVTMGTRHNCVPREDEDSRLHGVDRYVARMDELKVRQLVSVAVLAGPVQPSGSGDGFDVDVQPNDNGIPQLQWSCTTAVDGAAPGIRLQAFAAAFNEPPELEDWAYRSVCDADLTVSFSGLGHALKEDLRPTCLPAPLKGCADPGVIYDTPRAAQTCAVNDHCLPTCTVTDLQEQGLPTEREVVVPPCLEVAPDGTLLPDNTQRFQAYASGLPNLRDAALPVPACWFIDYQEQCEGSRFAELLVARRQDPPPRTMAAVLCDYVPPDEHQCGDGADNDEDCLVDMDDPCCQNEASCETD